MDEWREVTEGESNSEDGVAARLNYYGEKLEMEKAIRHTVLRLPQKVRDFALTQCRFISVGCKRAAGITVPGRTATDDANSTDNMWFIVLDDNLPPDEIEAAIAHEIAHAWRGDDRCTGVSIDDEVQAGILARDWGFVGNGANPEWIRECFSK